MLIQNILIVLLFTIGFAYFAIPKLRELKYGQVVREDGPKSHLVKTGIPTMGGIIFIMGSLLGGLLMFSTHSYKSLFVLLGLIIFAPIGFYDDYLKIKKKNTDGLSAKHKLIFQFFVAFFMTGLSFFIVDVIYIPFFGYINYSIWLMPLMIIMYVAVVNAVNFTDGIDGLCGSVTFVISLVLTLIISDVSLRQMVLIIAASITGFLMFNLNPAKVFMGDTGSFALGGYIASISLVLGIPLYLPIFGFVYLAEILSVMIQVPYFKKTGKRIFKMTPIHHHFELSGWSEWTITIVFSIVSAILTTLVILVV